MNAYSNVPFVPSTWEHMYMHIYGLVSRMYEYSCFIRGTRCFVVVVVVVVHIYLFGVDGFLYLLLLFTVYE